MYPAYYDNGLEIRKNNGCNFTAKDFQPPENSDSYEVIDHHQYAENNIDRPKNFSWQTYPTEKVRMNERIFFKFSTVCLIQQ